MEIWDAKIFFIACFMISYCWRNIRVNYFAAWSKIANDRWFMMNVVKKIILCTKKFMSLSFDWQINYNYYCGGKHMWQSQKPAREEIKNYVNNAITALKSSSNQIYGFLLLSRSFNMLLASLIFMYVSLEIHLTFKAHKNSSLSSFSLLLLLPHPPHNHKQEKFSLSFCVLGKW